MSARRWPSERYVRALLRHLRFAPPEPGTVTHIEVRHDDHCPRLTGDPCTCDPVVESGARVNRRYQGVER